MAVKRMAPSALLITAFAIFSQLACEPEAGRWANIVPNPGFEEVAKTPARRPAGGGWVAGGWSRPNPIWRVDDTVSHTGKRSLFVTNTDPKLYSFPSVVVPCKPGESYDISAWVKTKDIKNAGQETGGSLGATICLEWTRKDGKWMGGFYQVQGLLGTHDWQRISAENVPIPRNAAKVTFTVYLRKGLTGQAWFDDVSVSRHRNPLMTTFLAKPNYRGIFFKPGDGVVVVTLNLEDHDLKADSLVLTVGAGLRAAPALPSQPGSEKALWTRELAPHEGTMILSFPSNELPDGKSELFVTLSRKDSSEVLASAKYALEKRNPPSIPGAAWIDERNNLIVDGKPFFPLGWYFGGDVASPTGMKDLEALRGTAFNCVMNYGITFPPLDKIRAYMDKAQEVGIKIIFSIKDVYAGTRYCPSSIKDHKAEEDLVRTMVKNFGTHPALLAWYLNDELPQEYLQRLRERYQLMCEIEPNHPTWIVHYYNQEKLLAPYVDTTDVMGIDPYPIPTRPVTAVSEHTNAAVAAVAGARPVWVVPQTFGWYRYHVKEVREGKRPPTEKELKEGREPSLDEIRCMSCLALIHKAKGLVYYCYHDLKKSPNYEARWAGLKEIAGELKKFSEIILRSDRVLPPPLTCDTKAVDFGVWRDGSALYILATNTNESSCKAVFKLAESLQPQPTRVERLAGFGATQEPPQLVGAAFADDFPPFACRAYVLK